MGESSNDSSCQEVQEAGRRSIGSNSACSLCTSSAAADNGNSLDTQLLGKCLAMSQRPHIVSMGAVFLGLRASGS